MRMKEAQTRFFPEPMVYDQESKQMKYITLVNQSPEHDGEGITSVIFNLGRYFLSKDV